MYVDCFGLFNKVILGDIFYTIFLMAAVRFVAKEQSIFYTVLNFPCINSKL